MTHPLFEGTRELARRFLEERRARRSLSAEEFLDALPASPAHPAGIARADWVALLDRLRNARASEIDGLVGEWLEQLPEPEPTVGAPTLRLEETAQGEATFAAPSVPAEDARYIDRRYRIIRLLGEGAFGKVFLVADKLQNDQQLALKLIKKEHTATSAALVRFKNEILLLRVLNHPGIPQIFNDGMSEDGEFYYTMAYVEGRTLDDVIRKEAPLDPLRIVRITKQIIDVLEYAHSRGAIHRDLKPGNIFLLHAGTAKEQVRVLDFGIAKVLSREGMLEHAQTMHTEMPLGTPHYMSPEQVRGSDVDGRTDLYALGVILYQMCSGRFPFSGKTLMEILAARLEKPADPLEDATTPEWLRGLVMKLLEREREARPDTASIRATLDQLSGSHREMSRKLTWIGAAVVVIGGVLGWIVFKGGSGSGTEVSKLEHGAGLDDAGSHAAVDDPQRQNGEARATPNQGDGKRESSNPGTGDASETLDTDGDGTPDIRDDCPKDKDKTKPGRCGCGVPEKDSDGDGTPDCVDECPADPNKTKPGKCGCGVPDTDRDGDNVPDCNDDFPDDPSKSKRTADDRSSTALPAFDVEKLEPEPGTLVRVQAQQKTLHVSGRATRPLASVRINGVKHDLDASDPARFEADVALPEVASDAVLEDQKLTIELVDKDALETLTRVLNYQRLAPRMPRGCRAVGGSIVDARGRVNLILHEASNIRLALVDAGPDQPGFYLGTDEVQKRQLDAKAGQPLDFDHPVDLGQEALPVVSITFEDAQKFCAARQLRLPTTAEWDLVAKRAGHAFPWGDEFVEGACNSSDSKDKFLKAAPSRSFPQDVVDGVFYDLAGNVSEWCADPNGKPALRGGSWRSAPTACKLTAKGNAPALGGEFIGFRVALSLEP